MVRTPGGADLLGILQTKGELPERLSQTARDSLGLLFQHQTVVTPTYSHPSFSKDSRRRTLISSERAKNFLFPSFLTSSMGIINK